jgi:hypothetical protein
MARVSTRILRDEAQAERDSGTDRPSFGRQPRHAQALARRDLRAAHAAIFVSSTASGSTPSFKISSWKAASENRLPSSFS